MEFIVVLLEVFKPLLDVFLSLPGVAFDWGQKVVLFPETFHLNGLVSKDIGLYNKCLHVASNRRWALDLGLVRFLHCHQVYRCVLDIQHLLWKLTVFTLFSLSWSKVTWKWYSLLLNKMQNFLLLFLSDYSKSSEIQFGLFTSKFPLFSLFLLLTTISQPCLLGNSCLKPSSCRENSSLFLI